MLKSYQLQQRAANHDIYAKIMEQWIQLNYVALKKIIHLPVHNNYMHELKSASTTVLQRIIFKCNHYFLKKMTPLLIATCFRKYIKYRTNCAPSSLINYLIPSFTTKKYFDTQNNIQSFIQYK